MDTEKFMRYLSIPITLFTLLATLALPGMSAAEEAEPPPPVIVVTHCMKSTSPGYVDLETEMWQPMQQHMVDQGKKLGWAVYWVMFGDRSECDYYVVESYLGGEQFNAAPDLEEVFDEVHPRDNYEKAMAKTYAAREMVASSSWVAIDGVDIQEHQFITVNQMQASDHEKYVKLEREVWKPVHQALTDAGHRSGWGLYWRLSPGGDSLNHNYSTVDFFNEFKADPTPEMFKSVHPDLDSEKLMEQTAAVRDAVYSETWFRVAGTTPAAKKD
jgi:hypothetical protein